MSWLADLGKKISKATTKVGDGVITLVTKDVPNVVTVGVPHVVTKEIPEFFAEDIPDFAGEVFDGPDRDKKDPTLPKRRAEIAKLRAAFEAKKETFFTVRAELSESRRAHETLLETFTEHDAHAAPQLHVSEREWEMPGAPASSAPEAMENSVRYVLGFVTFDLTEHAWHNKDNRQEHEYLNRQQAALKPVLRQLDRAIGDMNAERAELDSAIAEMKSKLDAAGLAADARGVSALTLQEAERAARETLAQKMLGDGSNPADIAFVTGLTLQDVAALSPIKADMLSDEQAKAVLTLPAEQ